MKKLIIALTLIGTIVLTACGQSTSKTQNTSAANTTSKSNQQSSNSAEQSGSQKTSSNIKLPDEIKDPSKAICFDTPSWQLTQKGYARMLNRGDLLIVYEALYRDKSATKESANAVKSTDDVFQQAFDDFKIDTEAKFMGNTKGYKIEKNEPVTIVGQNMTKFKGYIDLSDDKNPNRHRYLMGYSFIKDDTPAYIAGIVMDDSQSDALKKEVDDTVTAMINTLRDKRK